MAGNGRESEERTEFERGIREWMGRRGLSKCEREHEL
jgi:hypothetical protein